MKETMSMVSKKEKENLYPNGFVYEGDFVGGRPRGNANITSGGKTIPVQYSDGRFYQV